MEATIRTKRAILLDPALSEQDLRDNMESDIHVVFDRLRVGGQKEPGGSYDPAVYDPAAMGKLLSKFTHQHDDIERVLQHTEIDHGRHFALLGSLFADVAPTAEHRACKERETERWCCDATVAGHSWNPTEYFGKSENGYVAKTYKDLGGWGRVGGEIDALATWCRNYLGVSWNGVAITQNTPNWGEGAHCSAGHGLESESFIDRVATSSLCHSAPLHGAIKCGLDVYRVHDCGGERLKDEVVLLREEVLKPDIFTVPSKRLLDLKQFNLKACCTFDIAMVSEKERIEDWPASIQHHGEIGGQFKWYAGNLHYEEIVESLRKTCPYLQVCASALSSSLNEVTYTTRVLTLCWCISSFQAAPSHQRGQCVYNSTFRTSSCWHGVLTTHAPLG